MKHTFVTHLIHASGGVGVLAPCVCSLMDICSVYSCLLPIVAGIDDNNPLTFVDGWLDDEVDGWMIGE